MTFATARFLSFSKSEFIRAVKCSTGFELDPHLVDVLYKIFDDGDGKLSYSEFLGIMNDRLHRGFKVRTTTSIVVALFELLLGL